MLLNPSISAGPRETAGRLRRDHCGGGRGLGPANTHFSSSGIEMLTVCLVEYCHLRCIYMKDKLTHSVNFSVLPSHFKKVIKEQSYNPSNTMEMPRSQ